MTTRTTWIARLRAAAHAFGNPAGDGGPAVAPTDEEILAAFEPITAITAHSWRINPLLDLPLKDYGGMNKVRLWEMFVGQLADSEASWIVDDEKDWGPPSHRAVDLNGQPLTEQEADSRHAAMMAWWHEHQEAPLRPSDPAAAVSVWLWRNGLHDQAVDVFARIWNAVRAKQHGIGWTVENALEGFRGAAYRDWDDDDQQQFAELFRVRHVDPDIESGLEELTEKH
ncbi:Uncharacterised protein [Mycobacteroides abscessus subsp. abscessus]|uniref:hypothetical protein n=1 Tax=Mycobacteroides abscessus TaxID=36809 RepID=UPI0009258A61|nr:hypothetical protein [Mycobacteroides abscessus]SHQ67495.1 Uncharacterised protein [Mycobacteroides abscessus subsp. abscessus]SHR91029.1 Uncharacterised protein [Mycobacteroides abscessus subsp. abscessus]SIH64232.1 Uncharacterised protein [Mycobacteroides abscessus subsp. abscessus]